MNTKWLDKYGEALCLAYKEVAAFKWDELYTCKKGHVKFYDGDTPFSRKCTICKVTNSVTANTVFDKQRIGLDKCLEIVRSLFSFEGRPKLKALLNQDKMGNDTRAIWSLLQRIYKVLKPAIPVFEKDVVVFTFSRTRCRVMGVFGVSKGKTIYYATTISSTHNRDIQKFISDNIKETAKVAAFDFNDLKFTKRKVINIPVSGRDYLQTDPLQVYAEIKEILKYVAGLSTNSRQIEGGLNLYSFLRNGGTYDGLMCRLTKDYKA